VLLSKEPPGVDAWHSPERLTLRPGIQIRINKRRFSGCAALDDSDNYCRQYDEVKDTGTGIKKSQMVFIFLPLPQSSVDPTFSVKTFNAIAIKI
jgi:hypothetical protein